MAEAPFAPQLERLQQLVDQSNRIVFFGGAGVSTESGIPDFRSVDGLYRQQWQYPPEEIVSHSFFTARTEAFYDFYRAKMLCLEAEPNAAHLALARLEAAGKLRSVVTQNIDGLHQAAGLIDYYRGDELVLINRSPTPRDRQATLLLPAAIGEVLGQLKIN